MNFLELVATRQTTRAYTDKPVHRDAIEPCIEAARLAPSACNSQPWKFLVVDDPAIKDRIANKTFTKLVSFNNFTTQAPVIVVIVCESAKPIAHIGGAIKNKDYRMMDIAIAAEHFCLQAAQQGLATAILGWFDEPAVKKILHIPAKKPVPLLITLGHPKSDRIREKKRKDLDQIRCYNNYIG